MTKVRLRIADYLHDDDPAIATAARGAQLAVALLADTLQARRAVDDDPDGPEPDDDQPYDDEVPEPSEPRPKDGRTASWGSTAALLAWCRANDVEWSGRGRPSKALIDSYLASTQDGAA